MSDPLSEIVEIGARALCGPACKRPECRCLGGAYGMREVLRALDAAGYAVIPSERVIPDLDFLIRAIKEGDPTKELLLRTKDIRAMIAASPTQPAADIRKD